MGTSVWPHAWRARRSCGYSVDDSDIPRDDIHRNPERPGTLWGPDGHSRNNPRDPVSTTLEQGSARSGSLKAEGKNRCCEIGGPRTGGLPAKLLSIDRPCNTDHLG